MSRLINIEQICEIRVYRKSKDPEYYYVPESTSLFGKVKEHHYSGGILSEHKYPIGSIAQRNKNRYEEVNEEGRWVVYYKPHLELEMSSGQTKTRWYETVEQLEADLELITRGLKFI